MSKSNSAIALFKEIIETHQVIGYHPLRAAIINARKTTTPQQLTEEDLREQTRQYIITTVCKKFGISKQEMLHGQSHGDRMDAVMVASVIMKKQFKDSHRAIAKTLNKDYSNIGKSITEYNTLRPEADIKARMLVKKCDKLFAEAKDYYETISQQQ